MKILLPFPLLSCTILDIPTPHLHLPITVKEEQAEATRQHR